MQKLVKIKFRDRTNLTLPMEMVEAILDSKDQLIKIYNSDGVWTGQTVNKADILGTERDFEEEKREADKNGAPRLAEPSLQPEKMKELLEKYKFSKNES